MLESKNIGTVRIEKEGMYYKIFYKCNLPDDHIYRLVLLNGDDSFDLGICIPSKGSYHLAGRISTKNLQANIFSFVLSEVRKKTDRFPVETGIPFEKLDQLEYAHLETKNENAIIVIDQFQDR